MDKIFDIWTFYLNTGTLCDSMCSGVMCTCTQVPFELAQVYCLTLHYWSSLCRCNVYLNPDPLWFGTGELCTRTLAPFMMVLVQVYCVPVQRRPCDAESVLCICTLRTLWWCWCTVYLYTGPLYAGNGVLCTFTLAPFILVMVYCVPLHWPP